MGLVDTAIFGLTALALPWAIIELGLSAYAVSVFDADRYGYYIPALAARSDFLLFASLWTILVAIILLVAPLTLGKRGSGPSWAGPLTIGLNAITMIFWLAGFAAWANLFIGAPGGVAGAILAFAVMLWLIFLGLLILSLLAFFNVLHSERFGYGKASNKHGMTTPVTTATPSAAAY